MLMKLVSAAIGALIPILFLVGIHYWIPRCGRPMIRAVLNQMCPQVWANMDKIRAMPPADVKQIMAFCPEA